MSTRVLMKTMIALFCVLLLYGCNSKVDSTNMVTPYQEVDAEQTVQTVTPVENVQSNDSSVSNSANDSESTSWLKVNDIPEEIWDVDENTIIWASFDDMTVGGDTEERINKKLEEDGYPFRLKCVDLGMGDYVERVKNCGADIVFDGMEFGSRQSKNGPAYDAILEGKFLMLDDYLKDSKLYDFFPESMWDSVRVNGHIYTVINTNFADNNLAVVFKRSAFSEYELESFDGTMDSIYKLVSENRKLFTEGATNMAYLDMYGIPNYDAEGIYFDNGTIRNILELDIVRETIDKMHNLALENKLIDGGDYNSCLDEWAIALIDGTAELMLDEEKYMIKRYRGDMYPRFNGALAIRENSHNPEYAFKMLELFITDSDYGNLIIYGDRFKNVNGYAVDTESGQVPYSWPKRLQWGINDGILRGTDTDTFVSPEQRKAYYKDYLRPAYTVVKDYPDLTYGLADVLRKHRRLLGNSTDYDKELSEWIKESEDVFSKYGPKEE